MTPPIHRRDLLKLGAAGALAPWAGLEAWAQTAPLQDYRALVCVFLFGGNDGNNLLVPTDSSRYAQYQRARPNAGAAARAVAAAESQQHRGRHLRPAPGHGRRAGPGQQRRGGGDGECGALDGAHQPAGLAAAQRAAAGQPVFAHRPAERLAERHQPGRGAPWLGRPAAGAPGGHRQRQPRLLRGEPGRWQPVGAGRCRPERLPGVPLGRVRLRLLRPAEPVRPGVGGHQQHAGRAACRPLRPDLAAHAHPLHRQPAGAHRRAGRCQPEHGLP